MEDKDFLGMRIVITGKLSDGWLRAEAIKFIESLGGVVQSRVTGTTTHLLVGERPGKNKIHDARVYGVPAITEDELLDRIG